MIDDNVILGIGVDIPHPDLVNIYGCEIGDYSQVSPFVEIGRGCKIGKYCRIRPFVNLDGHFEVEDYVFIANGVMMCNDVFPMSYTDKPNPTYKNSLIKHHSSIGTNCTILPGVTIGPYALAGAGSVITKDIPPYSIVVGNPARIIHQFNNADEYYAHLGGQPE